MIQDLVSTIRAIAAEMVTCLHYAETSYQKFGFDPDEEFNREGETLTVTGIELCGEAQKVLGWMFGYGNMMDGCSG